jgi:hypothetical protein
MLRLRAPKHLNLWVAAALIAANLYTWATVIGAATPPYLVEPIRDPEIVLLLDYIRSGDHGGETWQVTLTEREAEQTIAWYLDRWPQIPFSHPRVRITPDYVAGEGDATIAGLRVHVGARVRVTLSEDGLPVVRILQLSLPVPGPIRQAIEGEIQTQLQRAEMLPVRFTSAEWRDGMVIVRGKIR